MGSSEPRAPVVDGRNALARGEWPQARDAFRAALAEDETPEALAGLGEALWWLGEIPAAIDHLERSYAAFRRHGDPAKAAYTAVRLAIHSQASLGNAAAASGWLGRARRLVDTHGIEPLRGWVLLVEAYTTADPYEGAALAARARELADVAGDLDLELCALSQTGAALVDQGRVAEGVRFLDEAMAGSLAGEGGRPDTVVFASCNTMIACTACAEFERVVQWIRAADRFTHRFGCPFLYAECRTLYGAVLTATGDWVQAEEELATAVETSRAALPGLYTQALASLARLRLDQGRLEEAERLVVGLDGPATVQVTAAAHLVRGRPASAESAVREGLAELDEERLEVLVLRELLGDALVAQGKADEAFDLGRSLAARGADQECKVALARGERLCGRALAGTSDMRGAQRHLDTARAAFTRLGMPLEAARTRVLRARALCDQSPEAAVDEARSALTILQGLDARRDADAAAALLRELGVTAATAGPRGVGDLTRREREVLELLGQGLANPEIAERLYLSRKTVEHHVARILTKLGLRSRAEAAAEAFRHSGGVAP